MGAHGIEPGGLDERRPAGLVDVDVEERGDATHLAGEIGAHVCIVQEQDVVAIAGRPRLADVVCVVCETPQGATMDGQLLVVDEQTEPLDGVVRRGWSLAAIARPVKVTDPANAASVSFAGSGPTWVRWR